MTQQVRSNYRKHRKATWVFALLLAVTVAAVLVPLASGSGPQTYTLTGNAAACAGTTSVTFDVTLKNTAKTQNLGSADLYAPSDIRVTGATIGTTPIAVTTYPNAVTPDTNDPTTTGRSLISLRSLTVPGGSPVKVTVTASLLSPPGSGTSWYSIVKQANSFNPGDLDTSNTFTLQGSRPTFTVSTCTLAFVQQPPTYWQKATTASSAVAVALEAAGQPVDSSGLSPSLSAVLEPPTTGTPDFAGLGTPTYDPTAQTWSWPNLMPNSGTPSGTYHLVASATGYSGVNSTSFQVADSICQAGQNCPPVESNPDPNAEGSGAAGINNTLPGPVTLDFTPGLGDSKCSPWNRAFYVDASNQTVYFPTVTLGYNWGQKMLQVTYLVRNSEWVLTNVSRGNQDVEICVGAHHQANPSDSTHPFTGKYGNAVWDGTNYWGVINSVSNPNKVGSNPVVCNRGTTSLPTGPGGTSETWRSWTVCIPYDWDIHLGG